jgi:allantoate deiminase
MQRCDSLGRISDEPGRLTRTFHSPAMRRANRLVAQWMRQAGLTVREDAAFNLLGRWPSKRPGAQTLLLGSHLDTVRSAGKYDGALGVLAALAAVTHLRGEAHELPFHIEVVGFSDEEGVRYQLPYIGSRALAGTLSKRNLAQIAEQGIERARRPPGSCLGYVEVHIEQGPRLEERNVPIAPVTSIVGQSRIRLELVGRAGHAGTTPMESRHDALAGAAEIVLAAERCGVVATVGQLTVEPGASNVIPGRAMLTLDVRHAQDRRRASAVRALRVRAREVARRRGLRLVWTLVHEEKSVPCDRDLTRRLSAVIARRGLTVVPLASGAGHDAAALGSFCPVTMLFVRCRRGVSHHPAESVRRADVAAAVGVLSDFVLALAARHA